MEGIIYWMTKGVQIHTMEGEIGIGKTINLNWIKEYKENKGLK